MFEFAGRFDGMEEGHQRLMKNFYPFVMGDMGPLVEDSRILVVIGRCRLTVETLKLG